MTSKNVNYLSVRRGYNDVVFVTMTGQLWVHEWTSYQ